MQQVGSTRIQVLAIQSADMERVYLVTPEMRGLTWPRLVRMAVVRSVLYFLLAILFSFASKGHWTGFISAAIVGSIFDLALLTFSPRLLGTQRLRVTDASIEEIDGPIVHRDELLELKEHSDSEPHGLEIVGKRNPSWLPKYRIFIPASVDGFHELRQLLDGWVSAGR